MLHMTPMEVMATRYGEMLDMISCMAIYNGAEPKAEKMSFEDALKLR